MTATALALPVSAFAQYSHEPVQVVVGGSPVADSLHRAALRLNDSPTRYREAADMHLRSAAMRGRADPQGVQCLVTAGRLLYYAGDIDGSQETLTAGGDRARARGDVITAANAYVDAGILAQSVPRRGEAEELGQRAEALASSPLLSEAQRTAIIRRMLRTTTLKTATASEQASAALLPP